MRFPVAVSASIFFIALYFALFWGFDALRVLSSPAFGLDDAWRSQIVYWIGRFFGLGPTGLLNLAAAFAVLKLTAAGVCAVHVADRIRCFNKSKANADIFEVGLLLIVIVSILSVMPAMWQHEAGLIRANTLNLVLASLAAALSIIDREEAKAPKPAAAPIPLRAEIVAPAELAAIVPAKAQVNSSRWYSPWR